jgi:sec-independent protein translocase protein TatC
MAKKPTDDLFEKSTMTFGEHLEELRVCLFRGVVGVVLGVVIGFFVANWVVRFFQSPLEKAMERYYVSKALGDLAHDYGDVSYEVRRMILDEKVIPDPLQLDTSRLAEALKLTYPERYADLEMSPYWFTVGDLVAASPVDTSAAKRIGQSLRDAAGTKEASPRKRMMDLLHELGRDDLLSWSTSSNVPTVQQSAQLIAALNLVAGDRRLHDFKEFQGLAGPDSAVTQAIRKSLAEHFDPEQSRRLNKLLISSLFPGDLKKARINLLSVFTWRPVKVRFQVLNAQEAFMIWMKAALMTGLVLASPYIFYQIWIFVAAGLYPHEKHYVYLYLPISIALFLGGASLAFAFVFQPVLDFLFTFNKGMNADFDPRVGEWLSFVLILPLGFGISFQLPLVMLFLHRIGVATLDFYIQQWRVAILTICVISMVLTPADPVSMLLMAAPLCLLYVLGIAMCKYMPSGRSPFAEAYEP